MILELLTTVVKILETSNLERCFGVESWFRVEVLTNMGIPARNVPPPRNGLIIKPLLLFGTFLPLTRGRLTGQSLAVSFLGSYLGLFSQVVGFVYHPPNSQMFVERAKLTSSGA